MGKDARGIFLRVEVVCGLRLAIGLIIYSYIRLKNHLSNKSWNIKFIYVYLYRKFIFMSTFKSTFQKSPSLNLIVNNPLFSPLPKHNIQVAENSTPPPRPRIIHDNFALHTYTVTLYSTACTHTSCPAIALSPSEFS